jgi:hypothetical protein
MVERFNATCVPQLAKLQEHENHHWDDYLQSVIFSYNIGLHSTTRYSLFQLRSDRECRLSTDSASQYVLYKSSAL